MGYTVGAVRLALMALCSCSSDPFASGSDDAVAVERIALEADFAERRRHRPSASIALDQRSVPKWAGQPGSRAAAESVARSLGVAVPGPGDSTGCVGYGGSPVCGLDRYDIVIAVAGARLDGENATVEVFGFYSSEGQPARLSMGIAEYSFRKVQGHWQVVETWVTAQ